MMLVFVVRLTGSERDFARTVNDVKRKGRNGVGRSSDAGNRGESNVMKLRGTSDGVEEECDGRMGFESFNFISSASVWGL